MRILITGAKGQLGYDLMRCFENSGHEIIGVDVEEMDITDAASVESVMFHEKPDAVIHCAAYTQVDRAEDEPDLCEKINADGTRNIAEACRACGIKMMYISTDYVFDGGRNISWNTEDTCDPVNVYGRTKYLGELAVQELLERYFIVRTSWVFGINGRNFIRTMLELSKNRDALTVVDDQIGSPTYTYDLARLLAGMVDTDLYGIYHATNEGFCSWYELACEVFRQAGVSISVTPVGSDKYPTKAARPQNSRMSKAKLEAAGFVRLPHWKDAVGRYLKELKVEEEGNA